MQNISKEVIEEDTLNLSRTHCASLAALLTPGVLWQIGIHKVGESFMFFLYFCPPVSPILPLLCWGYRWVLMDRRKVCDVSIFLGNPGAVTDTSPLHRLHCEFPWCIKIPVEDKHQGRAQKHRPALRHWIISFRDSYQCCFGLVNFLFLSQCSDPHSFCLLLLSRHLHALIHDKWFHLMHIWFPCLPTRKR